MTDQWPRTFALFSGVLGSVGAWYSLLFLTSPFTILFFLLGASVWGFFLWRSFSPRSDRLFIAGWIWSVLLHFCLLPISGVIKKMFQTDLPIPGMIFTMVVLGFCGLFSEAAYYSHLRENSDPN